MPASLRGSDERGHLVKRIGKDLTSDNNSLVENKSSRASHLVRCETDDKELEVSTLCKKRDPNRSCECYGTQ